MRRRRRDWKGNRGRWHEWGPEDPSHCTLPWCAPRPRHLAPRPCRLHSLRCSSCPPTLGRRQGEAALQHWFNLLQHPPVPSSDPLPGHMRASSTATFSWFWLTGSRQQPQQCLCHHCMGSCSPFHRPSLPQPLCTAGTTHPFHSPRSLPGPMAHLPRLVTYTLLVPGPTTAT